MAGRIATGQRHVRTQYKEFQPAAVGTDETTPIFTVKAGQRVLAASVMPLINSAGTTNSTFTLGDGDDPDGLVTSANIDLETATVGTIIDGSGAYLVAFGKLYTVDDTIDVVYTKNTAGATNPKVGVYITYLA